MRGQKPRPVGWGGTNHEGPLNHITEFELYPERSKEPVKGSAQGVAASDLERSPRLQPQELAGAGAGLSQ